MKVLILRFSSIGDIVLTTPVVRAIKTQLDEAEVHYATKTAFSSILEENPYLDKIHLLTTGDQQLVRSLKKEKFDVVIDLHNNLRTRFITWQLNARTFRFKKLNFQKWLMVNMKVDLLPNVHIVDRYMAAAADLGVKMDTSGLDYFIPDKDQVELDWLPATHRKGYYAVVLSATHNTKRLPVSRLIELCDRINKPIVLVGGASEAALGEEIEVFFQANESGHGEDVIRDKLNKRARIFNACGKFNLNQSASLIKQSLAVFTHDTGMMHIAAAFKKYVYSIWGNTIPGFGMYPYRTQFMIMENNKLPCRPCTKIGHMKCPKGHFKCMQELTFDFYLPD